MKIKIFWHIFLHAHWYTVVSEQMRILISSGLYDACEEINIGCLGSDVEKDLLVKYFINIYPKLHLRHHSFNAEEYEFPTLQLIEDDKSDYACLYFHAKGVTKWGETIINHWRSTLNEDILNGWVRHYKNICDGYDVSSRNFLRSPDHFSGNFWWANRRYIDTLPPIIALNHSYRWHAEQWIAMNKEGRFFYPEFIEPGENIFTIQKH